jgi:hypothetical protein
VRAALAVLLVAVAPALAAADGLDGFALPSRRDDAAALTRRAQAVAEALAREIGGCCRRAPGAEDLSATLAAARKLQAAGRLDEAADSFDVALRRASDAPHRVGDPAALVGALVARASIALARGETKLGESLLGRALRYDPTFALAPGEDSPTMRSALAREKARLGEPIGLEIDDLGAACGQLSPIIVVARFAAGGAEFRRFDGCKLVAAVVAAPSQSPEEIARSLAGAASGGGARTSGGLPGTRGGGPSARASEETRSGTVSGRRAGEAGEAPRPIYRRAWFWIAIGGVAAASAGAAFLIARDPGDELEVTPRF